MGQEENNTSNRKGKHFNWDERLVLERLYRKKGKEKMRIKQIATVLDRHEKSIRRELKRGAVTLLNSDLSEKRTYSAHIGENKARRELEAKGPNLKLGADYILVEETKKLLKKKYSPDAIIMHYEKHEWPTDTRISTKTLYRYIYEGLLGESGECLLRRGRRKRKKGVGGHRKHSRAKSAQKSISARPERIEERKDFGHWEMDSIVGGKGKGRHTLLTLLERSTRFVVIGKLPNGSSESIVRELGRLENTLGSKKFREAFKTITCDNGSEFMDWEGMERSRLTKKTRTRIYYAHPYTSWERGSNENGNGIIRRFIPKSSNISRVSKKEINEIQNWINNYPRRKPGGKTAREAVGTTLVA